jgi:hypothetical protein
MKDKKKKISVIPTTHLNCKSLVFPKRKAYEQPKLVSQLLHPLPSPSQHVPEHVLPGKKAQSD